MASKDIHIFEDLEPKSFRTGYITSWCFTIRFICVCEYIHHEINNAKYWSVQFLWYLFFVILYKPLLHTSWWRLKAWFHILISMMMCFACMFQFDIFLLILILAQIQPISYFANKLSDMINNSWYTFMAVWRVLCEMVLP